MHVESQKSWQHKRVKDMKALSYVEVIFPPFWKQMKQGLSMVDEKCTLP